MHEMTSVVAWSGNVTSNHLLLIAVGLLGPVIMSLPGNDTVWPLQCRFDFKPNKTANKNNLYIFVSTNVHTVYHQKWVIVYVTNCFVKVNNIIFCCFFLVLSRTNMTLWHFLLHWWRNTSGAPSYIFQSRKYMRRTTDVP